MSFAGATLQGSYSGATGTIYETGFYYGTSSGNLNLQVTGDGSNSASGDFQSNITGLNASTKYYYKAYVLEWNASTSSYVERFGEEHLAPGEEEFPDRFVALAVEPNGPRTEEEPVLPQMIGEGHLGGDHEGEPRIRQQYGKSEEEGSRLGEVESAGSPEKVPVPPENGRRGEQCDEFGLEGHLPVGQENVDFVHRADDPLHGGA